MVSKESRQSSYTYSNIYSLSVPFHNDGTGTDTGRQKDVDPETRRCVISYRKTVDLVFLLITRGSPVPMRNEEKSLRDKSRYRQTLFT